MRNLKRALSLTLASVMLLGMMVIGTSAASYPDVTEEHNVEAIEVLQAVGVMSGSDTGNFNPDSLVSRIEMAIVMSNLMNLKVDYFEGQCKFTDVPEWAGKYVAACEANGIVSGVGGGRYGTGNVTATQAALMMLKALGYFQYASDFEGGWDRNTARLASDLRLFTGMDVQNNTELTRNQVAQLALNTLKADVVVAEKNQSDVSVSVGDAVVDITGKVNYVVTASSEPFAYAIDSVRRADSDTLNGVQGCIIQLGEKLYNGKLKLDDNATDEFNRPARYWEYDGHKMQSYVKTDLLKAEWHEKVTGRMLFDTLGSSLVSNIKNNKLNSNFQYTLETYVDGFTADKSVEADASYLGSACFNINDITRTNTDKVGATGNGALTQVFIDTENTNGDTHQTVTVTVINTYLARADKDYDAKKDEVDLKVYNIDDKIDGTGNSKKAYVKTHTRGTNDSEFATEIIKVTGADFEIENIKADDNYLVTVARDEIITMEAPEVVSEVTLNSFKKGDWAKNDDVQYDYATTAQYDDEVLDIYDNINMKDVTYNVILDKYGYLIGIEVNEAVAQYLFLSGIDLGSSNLSKKNADANVIFTDGTMKTVTVNTDKSELASNPKVDGVTKAYTITGGGDSLEKWGLTNYAMANNWFTYTVDADGIYTLKQVGNYSAARTDGVRGAKKVAQSVMDASAFTKAQFDVNGKNRSMDGSKAYGTGDFTKVYGNSESVYINVKTTTINNKNGTVSMIVDKVDSCTTGIDNVDFTVKDIPLKNAEGKDTGAPKYETYVLYNSDGYVIAAVSMNPDDNGTSAKYAYVTSGIKQEDYLGGNTWRWGVDAIIDGEKVRLTEVNDTQEYIKENMAGNWYDVRFDKDGNVSSIKPTDSTVTTKPSAVDFDFKTGDKYITNVHNVDRATNGVSDAKGGNVVTDAAGIYHNQKFENFTEKLSSLLLMQDFTCSTHRTSGTPSGTGVANLHYDHFTLYTDNASTAGLGISPSTKIVVCLSEKHNGGAFDSVTAEFTGDQGMKDALKLLDSDKKSFDGYLGAVIKDGIATSIVLDDRAGDKDKQGGTTPSQPVTPGEEVKIDVKAEGFTLDTANSVFYDSEDVKLPGTKLLDILGGVRVTAVTGNKYTVVIPAAGQKATVSTTGDVTATLTGRNLVIDVKGAGTVTLKMPEAGVGTIELSDALKTAGEQIKDAKITNDEFGNVKATFTVVKPAWVYALTGANNDVEVIYDIYVDGVATKRIATSLKDAAYAAGGSATALMENSATPSAISEYTITNLAVTGAGTDQITAATAQGKTVSLVISSITWKQAKVEFVDNAGKALSMDAGNTQAYLATGTSAGTLKFKVNTTSTDAAKYSVEGAKLIATGAVKKLTDIDMTHVNDQVNVTDSFAAEGGKIVKVTVTPSKPIAPKFNITINGAGTNYAATALKDVAGLKTTNISDAEKAAVTLAASSNAYQVNENGSATLTFTVANYTNKLSKGLTLKYTVNGGSEKTVELTNGGAGTFTGTDQLMLITADQAVVVTAIETELVNFRVQDAEVVMDGTNLQVVVDFGQELKTVRVTDDTVGATDVLIYAGTKPGYAGSGASNITSAAKTGSKLVIVFDAGKVGGWGAVTTQTVTVDAAVSNADDEWNKQVEITLEKNATTGVWSVKEWDDNI